MEAWYFLDLETSGLTPRFGADIVEAAIVDTEGTPLLNTLAKPKKKVPKSATEIHGITNEMLADAPSSDEVRSRIEELLEGANVGIYNAPFDLRFLPRLPQIANVVCIMKAVGEDLQQRRPALGKAVELYGLQWPDQSKAHRALADAIMTARVHGAMRSRPQTASMRVNGRPIDRYRGTVFQGFSQVPEGLVTRTALRRKGLQPGGVSVATVEVGSGSRVPAGVYALFALDEAKQLPR